MGTGNFWWLSGPLKSTGSICSGVRSKRDHSIFNNGTTCDAAFSGNSLTTCFHFLLIVSSFAGVKYALYIQFPSKFCDIKHAFGVVFVRLHASTRLKEAGVDDRKVKSENEIGQGTYVPPQSNSLRWSAWGSKTVGFRFGYSNREI